VFRQNTGELGDRSAYGGETAVIENVTLVCTDESAELLMPSDACAPSCVEAAADTEKTASGLLRLLVGVGVPLVVEVGPGVPQSLDEVEQIRSDRREVEGQLGGAATRQDAVDRHRQ
jgi:hypothetical protein